MDYFCPRCGYPMKERRTRRRAGWHREDIKAALAKAGFSVSEVGRRLGVQQSTVSAILAGRRSKRIEEGIASLLGTQAAALWPDRYERSAR
jgi:Ner family transcriptional regulator